MPYTMLAIILMQGAANPAFFINEQRGTPGNSARRPGVHNWQAEIGRHPIAARRGVLGVKNSHQSARGPYVKRHSHRQSGLRQATPPA
jgi:hypothetical protein